MCGCSRIDPVPVTPPVVLGPPSPPALPALDPEVFDDFKVDNLNAQLNKSEEAKRRLKAELEAATAYVQSLKDDLKTAKDEAVTNKIRAVADVVTIVLGGVSILLLVVTVFAIAFKWPFIKTVVTTLAATTTCTILIPALTPYLGLRSVWVAVPALLLVASTVAYVIYKLVASVKDSADVADKFEEHGPAIAKPLVRANQIKNKTRNIIQYIRGKHD